MAVTTAFNPPRLAEGPFRGVYEALPLCATDPILKGIAHAAGALIAEQMQSSVVLPTAGHIPQYLSNCNVIGPILRAGKGVNFVTNDGEQILTFADAQALKSFEKNLRSAQNNAPTLASVTTQVAASLNQQHAHFFLLTREHEALLPELFLGDRCGTIIETGAGVSNLARLRALHDTITKRASRFIAHDLPPAAARIAKASFPEELPYIALPASNAAFGSFLQKVRGLESQQFILTMSNVLSSMDWRDIERLVNQSKAARVDRIVVTQSMLTSSNSEIFGAVKPMVTILSDRLAAELHSITGHTLDDSTDSLTRSAAITCCGIFALQVQSAMLTTLLRQSGYAVTFVNSHIQKTVPTAAISVECQEMAERVGLDQIGRIRSSPTGAFPFKEAIVPGSVMLDSTFFHIVADRDHTRRISLPFHTECTLRATFTTLDPEIGACPSGEQQLYALIENVRARSATGVIDPNDVAAFRMGAKTGVELCARALESAPSTANWIQRNGRIYNAIKQRMSI